MSHSQRLREQGNDLFRADKPSLSFSVRISILQEAKSFYDEAFKAAECKDDESSAAKNIAVVSRRLATLHREQQEITSDLTEIVKDHTKNALRNFATASVQASDKSWQWKSNLDKLMKDCYEENVQWLSQFPIQYRIITTEEYIELLPSCETKAEAYLDHARMLYNLAVEAVYEKKYQEAHRYLKECNYPLEEAKALEKQDEQLEEDVFKYICITDAMEGKTAGENLLQDFLLNEESLNMDMVWSVIDQFRMAVTMVREKDLQLEAVINSRIGHVYDKVLKMKERAHRAHKRAYELALTISPRYFTGEEWYKESQEFLQEYQRQKQKEEDEKEEKENAEIKKQIKEDLEKLKEQECNAVNPLLEFIYKTWPPKESGKSIDPSLSEKKKLQKAITHYHPDKQDKESHGAKWVVLCSEICKVLTNRYETYKGA